jgi:neutral amino acid transport system ATP-binding protein
LAKTIYGLLTPKQSKIIFEVENIARVPYDIVRHGMYYIPQISNLFSALSIDENLEVGAFI